MNRYPLTKKQLAKNLAAYAALWIVSFAGMYVAGVNL